MWKLPVKLSYALKNEKLVHVSEVNGGTDCDCICPGCGGGLIAKKGQHNSHHFAHHIESKKCKYGIETSLHLAAKEILSNKKKMKIPEVILPFGLRYKYRRIHKGGYIKFENVKLEHKLESIIPDLLIEINGHELLVEIKVTHGIDKKKLDKIKSLNVSTIEIDLSNYNREFDNNELSNILINDITLKRWVYNKKAERERERLMNNSFKIRVCSSRGRKFIVSCPIYTSEISFDEGCKQCSYLINYDKEDSSVLCGAKSGITN